MAVLKLFFEGGDDADADADVVNLLSLNSAISSWTKFELVLLFAGCVEAEEEEGNILW